MEVPENLAHGAGNFAMEAQTLELKCQRQAALITSLKAENKELQLERNDYMEKLKEKRGELTSLQGKLDDTTSEIADLKRALIRANDAVQQDYHDTVQRPKTEIPLTPLSSHPNKQLSAVIDGTADKEIHYLGSSSVEDVSELDPFQHPDTNHIPPSIPRGESITRQSTPRMVPYVSLPRSTSSTKRDFHQSNPEEIRTARANIKDLSRSPKRRKVEPILQAPPSRHVTITAREPQVLPSSPTASVITFNKFVPSKSAASHIAIDTNAVASSSTQIQPSARITLLPPKAQAHPETRPKLKEEAFIVPPSIVSGYLKSCKPLQINPLPSNLYVPRRFLRLTYGGSDQQFLQIIKPHLNPSGVTERRIVFPMYDINPSMPSSPGHPGLVYASRHEILKDPPWSVFYRHPERKKAVWTYLGEYKSTLCGTMEASLFRSQKSEVRNAWGELIRDAKRLDVYVAMRARIALRKAKLPIPVEKVNQEMVKIRNHNGRPVSIEDIVAAFDRGAEAVDIIKMECVAYDHAFAKDLEEKFEIWNMPTIHTERRSLKSKRKMVDPGGSQASNIINRRSRRRVDIGKQEGGEGNAQHDTNQRGSADQTHNQRTRSQQDPATGTRIPLVPEGEEWENVMDGTFHSDLTEYDYSSSNAYVEY